MSAVPSRQVDARLRGLRLHPFVGAAVQAALLLCLLGGCAPWHLADLLAADGAVVRRAGLRYGDEDRQRLDVYRPRREVEGAPVVVFLYGGRWQSGSRDEYRLVGQEFARRGWVAVIPDYRLYPGVRFPAWVRDAALAVRWARANASRYGGDSSRIVIVGHSAGAHSATLLAVDSRYLRDAGVPAQAVRGVVSIAGPVDTTWTAPDVQALMGSRPQWPATYPATYVDGTAPPLLLLHGAEDRTVSAANSTGLAALVRRKGGCARAITYRGLGHVGIVVSLALPHINPAPVMQDVARFVTAPAATACPERD